MERLLDAGSAIGIIATLFVVVVIGIVIRRRRRSRATRTAGQLPGVPQSKPEAAYLDSSHIIDGPPLAGGAERQARPPPTNDS